jgi:hypothetical protein
MRSLRIIVGVIAVIAALTGVFAVYEASADQKQKPDANSGLRSERFGF